jgi:hypothetical protein
MIKCDICQKEIDERQICGYMDGHVCLKCGYKPGESEKDSVKIAYMSVGITAVLILVIFIFKIII